VELAVNFIFELKLYRGIRKNLKKNKNGTQPRGVDIPPQKSNFICIFTTTLFICILAQQQHIYLFVFLQHYKQPKEKIEKNLKIKK